MSGIEKQLFDWKEWDDLDTIDMVFYDVTLKAKIGKFEAGTKFDSVALILSKSTIELYEKGSSIPHTFDLKLTVE